MLAARNAFKIDASRARAVDVVQKADAVQIIGFVGDIGRHRIDLALDQIVDIVGVLDPHQAGHGHAFARQVGDQLVGLGQLVGE
jgi:hypothetical protein